MTRIAVSGRAPVARAFLQVARERGLGVVAVHDVGDLDDDLGPTTIKLDRAAQPDWTALDVDVVVDCSEGVRSREQLAGHLAVGASAVVAAVPWSARTRSS